MGGYEFSVDVVLVAQSALNLRVRVLQEGRNASVDAVRRTLAKAKRLPLAEAMIIFADKGVFCGG